MGKYSKTAKNYYKGNNDKRNKHQKTRHLRLSNSNSLSSFQKEITVVFLEILLMVKLFHWKTTSYATHKATDELYTKLNANIDEFIEVLLGKTGTRTDLMGNKNIRLVDLSSAESLKREVEAFKGYLVGLNDSKAMKQMSNTDLYNIRDTILGDLNQFLYLLTFK
jgi:DNA-binding ferritin-like protein